MRRSKSRKQVVRTRIIRRMPCSLQGRITRSTHLHEGDEDDEERWWAACVVIGVVLSVPLLREEFIADHADHPESTKYDNSLNAMILAHVK